jgi:hypothetical protein
MDFEKNSLTSKLYPPLRNVAKGMYLAKGGNILEYRAKANTLPKIKHSHPSSTLAL